MARCADARSESNRRLGAGHPEWRSALTKEAVMAAPFIFIGTHKVKPGKLEEFQAWFADYCDTTVEPHEPRLLSFQAYADPDANEVTVVQVHPDAESMVHHMSVIGEHVGRAYADFLERKSRWQIYGTPGRSPGDGPADERRRHRSYQPGAVRRLHPTPGHRGHGLKLIRGRGSRIRTRIRQANAQERGGGSVTGTCKGLERKQSCPRRSSPSRPSGSGGQARGFHAYLQRGSGNRQGARTATDRFPRVRQQRRNRDDDHPGSP